jgi:hypothetical protein
MWYLFRLAEFTKWRKNAQPFSCYNGKEWFKMLGISVQRIPTNVLR